MKLGYWETVHLDKLMADPDLLKLYYYFCAKQDERSGYVEITLREAELGTGINKNRIKRKIEQLVMCDLIRLISSNRAGTKLVILEPFSPFDDEKGAVMTKYSAEIRDNDNEIWRRLNPKDAKKLDENLAKNWY